MKRLTKEEFIEKARLVHGDEYDYSKVEYINNKTKICIICPLHGEFWQTPDSHLTGNGCKECSGNEHNDNEKFIEKAKKVHGDKYDYSKVNYINNKTKVIITCPIHGDFLQSPSVHLRGFGCKKCSSAKHAEERRLTTEEFIEKARLVHGDRYDYSKVEYVNAHTKICLICPIHGEFWIKPNNHLLGQGCRECGLEICRTINKHSDEWFFEKAKEVHGDKYDYSNVKFDGIKKKVEIKCNECGEIFFQTPDKHIYSRQGCPICKQSHLEEEVMLFLKENNTVYEYQKKFDWLGKQTLDFYLPQYNVAIECQGKQHFGKGGFSNDKGKRQELFEITVERDIRKNMLCQENGVELYYYLKEKDFPKDFCLSIYEEGKKIKNIKNILNLIVKNAN